MVIVYQRRILNIVVGSFLLLTLDPCSASRDIMDKVDKVVRSGMSCRNFLGVSLAIVNNGQVLTRSYGHMTLARDKPVTNNTLFCIASLTKSFTATLLLKIMEEHPRINLRTKIHEIFGENVFSDETRSKHATLVDLMSHRMGIPNTNMVRLDENLTRSTLSERIKLLRPGGSFKTSFFYNNLMYELLTDITEKLGKDTWENLMTEKIFQPLGMTSSTFISHSDPTSNEIAQSYIMDNIQSHVSYEFFRKWSRFGGSGNILSTSSDMAKWMQFFMNNGRTENKTQLLSEYMMSAIFKPQNVLRTSPAKYRLSFEKPLTPVTLTQTTYGLGWRFGHYRGYPIVAHSGTTPAYVSYMFFVPNLKIGVYIAATGYDLAAMHRLGLSLYIIDLLMGEQPWLNETTVCTFPEPWDLPPEKRFVSDETRVNQATITPFPRALTVYAGVYANKLFGNIVITENETSNMLYLRHGFGEFDVYPDPSDNYVLIGKPKGLITTLMKSIDIMFNFDEGKPVSFFVPRYGDQVTSTFTRSSDKDISFTARLVAATSSKLVVVTAAFSVVLCTVLVLVFVIA